MAMLTDKQAYVAMYWFLDRAWELDKEKLLAAMLSDLTLWPDGTPGDPAFEQDWQVAVDHALNGGEVPRMSFDPKQNPTS